MAENLNILLIRGAEITRKMPPGHLNALFLDDNNLLEDEDPMRQIEAAVKAGKVTNNKKRITTFNLQVQV